MASAAELARGITIKTKMLQRLHKEYSYYQAEAEKEHSRVEAMKSAGADAHDLRQAVRGCERTEGCVVCARWWQLAVCCAALRCARRGGKASNHPPWPSRPPPGLPRPRAPSGRLRSPWCLVASQTHTRSKNPTLF